ncbi:MAG: hypothetical protein ABF289_20700 [Clostridiales bacterium]
MNHDLAYKCLTKITSLYNKNLTDEQLAIWLEEFEKLNELAVQKAIKKLKADKIYENCMPTLPQFFSIYKTFIQDKNIKQPYCYVCNNRGYEILRVYKNLNEKKTPYDYALHCDCCEIGKTQIIKYKKYYSEPISKYFNVESLMTENKKKIDKQKAKRKKELELDTKKELEEVYIALSL